MDVKVFFYTFFGVIADVLDVVLTYLFPDSRPQRSISPSIVDSLSDEEILELRKKAPSLQSEHNVFKLTADTVAKPSQDLNATPNATPDATEANVLNILFAETTIPVPRVRRVVESNLTVWIIMDFIPGSTLAELWSTLSTWRKICIAFTLRRYVRQLRRLTASATTPPGPLSAKPRKCHSPIFGMVRPVRGPFASYRELSDFFNERHKMTLEYEPISQDDPFRTEYFDDSEPLVLTHQDINLRNIIVDEKDGRLWMLDWAWAGYYPQYFEYVAMVRQNESERVSGTHDKFWKLLIPFICGPYLHQDLWLRRISKMLPIGR